MAGPIELLRRNDAACEPLLTRGGDRQDHGVERLNQNAARGGEGRRELVGRLCLALTRSPVKTTLKEAKSDDKARGSRMGKISEL